MMTRLHQTSFHPPAQKDGASGAFWCYGLHTGEGRRKNDNNDGDGNNDNDNLVVVESDEYRHDDGHLEALK